MKSSRERELKLSVPAGFRLPSLDVDGVVAGPVERRRLLATYLDTDDLRLARFGVTLRHRTGEGWTLKLPGAGRDGFLVREELVFGGDVRRPPAEVLDLVRAYARALPVVPQARLRTARAATPLAGSDGASFGELVDDRVSVLDGDGKTRESFRELELELASSGKASKRLVRTLEEAGASVGDQLPKLVRALGAPAQAPADVVAVEPGPDATAADVLRRALAGSVLRLIHHDPVVRLDADPEGVHKARVATRTLRSDLRTFRPLVDRAWSDGLRGELGWLGGLLGRVRDADVLLARLEQEGAPAAVVRTLRAERTGALADLLAAMRGERYLELLDRLVAAAQAPEVTERAALPAADVVPGLARRPWRSLESAVKGLGKRPADEELHEVRIKAKRCRYAAEAVAPYLGRRAAAFAKAAAGLQQTLGDLNDAVTAEAWLRDWASRRRPSASVTGALELADRERLAAKKCRARWRTAWKRLAASRPRAFA